jgi:hypothetical protein
MKDFKTQWQSGRHRLTTLSDNAKVADLMRHPHQGNRLLGPPLSPSSAVPVLRTYRLERELQQAPSDS